MAKLTTNDLTSFGNEASAIQTINNNFAAVETAMEKTLSRDGTTPNTMEAVLDMNSNRIINLPYPTASTDPVRKQELDNAVLGVLSVSGPDKILGRVSAGSGAVEEIACTSAGRALLDDASASAQRTTLSVSPTFTYDTRTALVAATVVSTVNAVLTHGYRTVGDGGGARYVRSASATSTQSADGAYWSYVPDARGYNVKAFGAIGDSTTTSTTKSANNSAFSAAVTAALAGGGGTIYIPAGDYTYDSPWVIDESAITPSLSDSGFVSVEGDGSGQTRLSFTSTTSSQVGITFTGASISSGGGHRGPLIRGISLLGPSTGISTSLQTGLYINSVRVNSYVEDVLCIQWYYGCRTKDIVGLDFYSCVFDFNNYGFYTEPTFVTSPVNELTFSGCHFGNNRQYGAYFYKSAPITIIGGSFESNGQPGSWTSDTDRYDLMMDNCGYNGVIALAIFGVHFESSGGAACIWIKHDDYPALYHINGCDFFRNGYFAQQSTNCVRLDTTGDSTCHVVIHGCAFGTTDGFAPTTSQRAVAAVTTVGSSHYFHLSGNLYESTNEIPDLQSQHDYAETDVYSRTVDFYKDGTFKASLYELYNSSNDRIRIGPYQNNALALVSNNTEVAIVDSTSLSPGASDGASLGKTSLMWSDAFLASGAVLNFNNGDVTITHSTNALAFAGAANGYTFDAQVKTQVTTVAGLTAAATAGAGARSFVTDANATTFASVVAGGGANGVPVYSDGTNWRIG